MGEQLSSGTMKTIGRVLGIAGLLCFFLTFAKISFLGMSESFSGFGLMQEIISDQGEMDSDDKALLMWLILSFAGGVVGGLSLLSMDGALVSGISEVLGAICLYILKDKIEAYGLDIGTGWTLAMICFVLTAVCAFVTLNLEGKEAAIRRMERQKAKEENPDKDIADKKLRDELAKFRVYDDEKK